jgi:hypothetical protein
MNYSCFLPFKIVTSGKENYAKGNLLNANWSGLKSLHMLSFAEDVKLPYILYTVGESKLI